MDKQTAEIKEDMSQILEVMQRIRSNHQQVQDMLVEQFPPVETKEAADQPLSAGERAAYERAITDLIAKENRARVEFHEELERRLDPQLSAAGVLLREAEYEQAEEAFRAILAAHPNSARVLNGLGLTLLELARFADAEPLMRRALQIDEDSFGPDHPRVATRLNNLATLLQDTNRVAEAEPLMRRALHILETSFGPDHPYAQLARRNLDALLSVLESEIR